MGEGRKSVCHTSVFISDKIIHNLFYSIFLHSVYTRPKTPVANRICRRCQTTQIDDEIHFLMQCNTFELDRKALLSEAGKYITNFNTQCDTEQFKSIMSSENNAIINALAKYTYVWFEKIVV